MDNIHSIGFDRSHQSEDTPERMQREKVGRAMNWLLVLTTILVVFGLTMLYSASYGQAGLAYFKKQLLWVGLGSTAAAVVIFAGYRKLAALSPFFMGISFVLLLIAKFYFKSVKGGERWLRFGGITIQPSEFAKIAIILFVSYYCSEHQRTFFKLRERYGLLPLILPVMAVSGAILLGKDLGTTILTVTTTTLTLFAAGLYLRYMVVPCGFGLLAGLYVYFFDPTRLARVTTFAHPEAQKEGKGYQLWNSLKAIGSGNWFGRGFMNSRMKAKYLPEAHTDFILSIIGEELGFVAMVILIVFYTLWGLCALRIALNAGSRLGTIMGFALASSITLQAAINIAVVSGSIPTKGMPAPFISYGGSNVIASLLAVGLLLSIAMDTVNPGYADRLHEKIRNILHLKRSANVR